jgi:hypothetical protein
MSSRQKRVPLVLGSRFKLCCASIAVIPSRKSESLDLCNAKHPAGIRLTSLVGGAVSGRLVPSKRRTTHGWRLWPGLFGTSILTGIRGEHRQILIGNSRRCALVGKVIDATTRVLTLGGLVFGSMDASAADTRVPEALKMITDTAAEICESVPLEQTSSGNTLSADAQAKLGGLVGRIVNLGLSGTEIPFGTVNWCVAKGFSRSVAEL